MTERDQWAWRYFHLGWQPLVLCDPRHEHAPPWHACQSPGKSPIGRWKELQSRKRDVIELRRELLAYPHGNLGLVLGPVSGLAAVDVDSPEGCEWLETALGEVPDAPRYSTGRGLRLLFRDSGARYQNPATGVEVLGEGRVAVAPPSVHESGYVYTWLGSRDLQPLPKLPDLTAEPSPPGEMLGEGPVTQNRNSRLFRLACALRRHGACMEEVSLCLEIFNRRCSPPLKPRELGHIARSACRYSPAPLPGGTASPDT